MKDIVIKNLSFSYDEKNVFKNFFARFPSGKMSIIMSPSGRGKTTLLYLMADLLKADKGGIEYPYDNPKFSFVFQDDRLIDNLSVTKNIRLVNDKLSDSKILECLECLNIKDYSGKKVKELSGGEQQRVAIARALLAEYDVLFMDEPFSGLDDDIKFKVIDNGNKKVEGKTVVVVTHYKLEAEMLVGQICTI